jgi:3',5'-cyclic-AMP phosphodiesterase
LHIDDNLAATRGIDTKSNFVNILNNGLSQSPDMILLGGDLCNVSGEQDAYHWVKDILEATSLPYHVIPGNHDSGAIMASVFYNEVRTACYRKVSLPSMDLIFLDTGVGVMDDDQWNWFGECLDRSKSALIFMHYPPVLVGSRHMEPKYAFSQIDRFGQLLASFTGDRISIFSGHFHMEANIEVGYTFNTYITPSTFIQINPDSQVLQLIKDKIGYRMIALQNNQVSTYVQYA